MQIEDHLVKANEWESRATLALQDNREELAREALLKIRTIEAETEADLELGDISVGTDLEAKFVELERKKKGDQALESLKAKMGERAQLAMAAARGTCVDELKAKLAKP